MTSLTKIVRRACTRTSQQGRPIIVALEPGDIIALRQRGLRTWYKLPLATVFWVAAKAEAAEQARAKAAARRARRISR